MTLGRRQLSSADCRNQRTGGCGVPEGSQLGLRSGNAVRLTLLGLDTGARDSGDDERQQADVSEGSHKR